MLLFVAAVLCKETGLTLLAVAASYDIISTSSLFASDSLDNESSLSLFGVVFCASLRWLVGADFDEPPQPVGRDTSQRAHAKRQARSQQCRWRIAGLVALGALYLLLRAALMAKPNGESWGAVLYDMTLRDSKLVRRTENPIAFLASVPRILTTLHVQVSARHGCAVCLQPTCTA